MSYYMSDINVDMQKQDAAMLVDEVSSTEIYVGISRNSKNPAGSNWRIKRIWQVGTVWNFGFPDGNQDFVFIWDDRYSYSYSM